MRVSDDVLKSLRCPVCLSTISIQEDKVLCNNPACRRSYPIIDGSPILLNEENSLFSVGDFVEPAPVIQEKGSSLYKLRRFVPDISLNVKAQENFARFRAGLASQVSRPVVLIVGGGTLGFGMESLIQDDRFYFVETDVFLSERTGMVCDCHDIPFEDGSFDGVIVQAVLEHVVDPYRCVSEIYRVLKPGGYVYAETPFMQQVHMGRYDFTRFTHLGHRRLFRNFHEIDSGAVCGPGMSLAWAYKYFLLSFTQTRNQRRLVEAFAAYTSFYLKYFDRFLIDKPAALDAASGVYFLGQKANDVLADRTLIQQYRGAIGSGTGDF